MAAAQSHQGERQAGQGRRKAMAAQGHGGARRWFAGQGDRAAEMIDLETLPLESRASLRPDSEESAVRRTVRVTEKSAPSLLRSAFDGEVEADPLRERPIDHPRQTGGHVRLKRDRLRINV
jgi:hypothetical protein